MLLAITLQNVIYLIGTLAVLGAAIVGLSAYFGHRRRSEDIMTMAHRRDTELRTRTPHLGGSAVGDDGLLSEAATTSDMGERA